MLKYQNSVFSSFLDHWTKITCYLYQLKVSRLLKMKTIRKVTLLCLFGSNPDIYSEKLNKSGTKMVPTGGGGTTLPHHSSGYSRESSYLGHFRSILVIFGHFWSFLVICSLKKEQF